MADSAGIRPRHAGSGENLGEQEKSFPGPLFALKTQPTVPQRRQRWRKMPCLALLGMISGPAESTRDRQPSPLSVGRGLTLRGLVQSRTRLGPWKDRLIADPHLLMEAYLECVQGGPARG